MPDVSLHKCMYFPMSDTGMFGSYLHGNEVHAPNMIYMGQLFASDYALYMNQAELYRARAELWNDLLNEQSGSQVNSKVANQAARLGRVLPRSEVATRLSHVCDGPHLNRVAREWLFDVDVGASVWGNLHGVASTANYGRAWKRSTLGWYGMKEFLLQ